MEAIHQRKNCLIANVSGRVVYGIIASATIKKEFVDHLVVAAVSSRYFETNRALRNSIHFLSLQIVKISLR